MPLNNILTGCPADCDDDNLLPAIDVNQDCTSYPQTLSQVSDLYIIPTAADDIMASWSTTPTAVTDAIDNTIEDNTKAKWLVGIGGIAAPDKTTTDYPKLKRKNDERLYTLTFRVLNLSDAQYNFLRQLQCGWTGFTFYYGDLADYVYGIAGGLVPEFIDVDFPKGEGNSDKNVGILTLQWRADGDPERRVNPLA